MINSFHMNPWLYLLTIPICIALIKLNLFIIEKNNLNKILLFEIIILLILFLLLFYLYNNNVIGIYDLILLILIFGCVISPILEITVFLNIILIPSALILSFIYRK